MKTLQTVCLVLLLSTFSSAYAGDCFKDGDVNDCKARSLHQDYNALNELGTIYYTGRGVAQDYGKAFKSWKRAAQQGNVASQLNLGHMYDVGEGVAQNYPAALAWFKKAAEQGDTFAAEQVKVVEEKMEFVGSAKTAEQGNAVAEEQVKVVEEKMMTKHDEVMNQLAKRGVPSAKDYVRRDASKANAVSSLQERDGIKYEINSEEPYTGRYVETDSNGNEEVSDYVNGKQQGLVTQWDKYGHKTMEVNVVDGKRHGLTTEWDQYGYKKQEANFVDGKRHGLWIELYDNGNKSAETNFVDGKEHGLRTTWYEKGDKASEVNVVDGKMQGIMTMWRGNEKREVNYVDGVIEESEQRSQNDSAMSIVLVVIIAFIAILIAGMNNKVVIYYDMRDFYIALMSWGSIIIGAFIDGMFDGDVISGIIRTLTYVSAVIFFAWSIKASIFYNKATPLGIIIGIFKTTASLLGALMFLGALNKMFSKEGGLKDFLVGTVILGAFVWIGKQLINGERVYRSKGWDLPETAGAQLFNSKGEVG